jgi:hypothetical protein
MRILSCGLSALAIGCGGGMPLLYPARTLPLGEVRATGGTSGNFVVGSLANELQAATVEGAKNSSAPGPPGTDPTYARGALVEAAVAPGLSPFIAARVGIGGGFEGGVSYTGRGARIDVRHSFDWHDVSLSIGLGGDAAFYGDQQGGTLPNVSLNEVHGYGGEVPVLLGWQSAARIYMAWIGVRGGWDHTDVSYLTTEPFPLPANVTGPTLSADRIYGGAVVGLAAGFRHVHAALELDVAYQVVNGTFNATSVTIQGVSLAPAAALWWSF